LRVALACLALLLAACDRAPPPRTDADIAAGLALAAIMTGEDLDRLAPGGAPHRVRSMWLGSNRVTCGAATGPATRALFLDDPRQSRDRLMVEGAANWRPDRWSAACADRSTVLWPVPPRHAAG
jgi:hypothetical protein